MYANKQRMYQILVARLIYLSLTRPDIAVTVISQFMHILKEVQL